MAYIRKAVVSILLAALTLSIVFSLILRAADIKAQNNYASGFFAIKAAHLKQDFDKLAYDGIQGAAPSLTGFDLDEISLNVNHIQGMGIYGEYTIITINGHYPDQDTGIIYIFDKEKIVQKLYTPRIAGEDLTHTGGMQVAGNYLYVVIEKSSPLTGANLLVYNLTPLRRGGEAYLYQSDYFSDFGTSMVGVTTFKGRNGREQILLCDSRYRFYLSDIPRSDNEKLNWSACKMQQDSQRNAPGEDNNVALITGKDNAVWIIGMQNTNVYTSWGMLIDYRDTLNLYPVQLSDDKAAIFPAVASKEVRPYDYELLALGSHFRFASTAAIDAQGFAVYSTQSVPIGAMVQGMFPFTLTINIYR